VHLSDARYQSRSQRRSAFGRSHHVDPRRRDLAGCKTATPRDLEPTIRVGSVAAAELRHVLTVGQSMQLLAVAAGDAPDSGRRLLEVTASSSCSAPWLL